LHDVAAELEAKDLINNGAIVLCPIAKFPAFDPVLSALLTEEEGHQSS
jgi:hypothetical protein